MMARHSCDKEFKMNGVKEKGQIKCPARLWHDTIHQMEEQNLFSLQTFNYKLSNVHDNLNFWIKLKWTLVSKMENGTNLVKIKDTTDISSSSISLFFLNGHHTKLHLQNFVLFQCLIWFRFITKWFHVRKLP